MSKITIIMPVFKVEKYLKTAIESILSQTEKDWDLILVDDGSPDNSGKICDEYSEKYDNIKVIHKQNEGAAIARNSAFKYITGEYTAFFDSDDWIENTMLEDLYNIANNNNLDLIISGFYIDTYFDDNNYFSLNYVPWDQIYTNKISFRENAYKYFDKNMFYSPWNKLYKTKYLLDNNIKFINTYRDDFPFVLDCIKNIDKIGFTSKQYYHFLRARSESETQKYVPTLYEKREEEHNWMVDLYKYWELYEDKNSLDMISRRYIDRIIECFVNLINPNSKLNKKEILSKISEILNNKNIDFSLQHAFPQKLYLKIMYLPLKLHSPFLCFNEAKFIYDFKNNHLKSFNYLKKNR